MSQSKSFNFIKLFAWTFLILGIVGAGSFLLSLLDTKLTDDQIKYSSELVIGFTGVFFSITSILFVVDNLRIQTEAINLQTEAIKKQENALIQQQEAIELQRTEIRLQTEEMKQANDTSKLQQEAIALQQAESTFFNLISHHKEIVNSLDIIGEYEEGGSFLESIHTTIETYKLQLDKKEFETEFTTEGHPIEIYHSNEILWPLKDSIETIIDFITRNLKGDDFYHRIFYNNLSETERFLFGMMLLNDISMVSTGNFDYTRAYVWRCSYINKKTNGYFPCITFEPFSAIDLKVKNTDEFFLIDDKMEYTILDRFEASIENGNIISETRVENDMSTVTFKSFKNKFLFLDLFDHAFIKKHINSIGKGATMRFETSVILHFDLNGKTYKVFKKFRGFITHNPYTYQQTYEWRFKIDVD